MSSGQDAVSGSTPPGTQAGSSQLVALEVQEVRQKVTRLIEQVDQNNGDLESLRNALTRLELIENQIQTWRLSFSRCVGNR